MVKLARCTECGAECSDGQTCTDHFHLMCAWELDHQLYDLHHLMVLCYYLQHPSLYSPAGLEGAKRLLVEFLEKDLTPGAARKRINNILSRGTRDYKIKGTPESHGVYEKPIDWNVRAADIIQAGIDNYYASVQCWAEATLKALRESGNLD